MNLSNIAAVAAGITGIMGFLAFIIYTVLHITSQHVSKLTLTTEHIDSLKRHGIDAKALQNLSPKKIKQMLESHENISKDMIEKVISVQTRSQGKTVFYISIALIFLALVFGVTAFILQRTELPVKSEKKTVRAEETKPLFTVENPILRWDAEIIVKPENEAAKHFKPLNIEFDEILFSRKGVPVEKQDVKKNSFRIGSSI
ncbi:MAG: hypothetical protein GY795_14460 [Desulfobacterales bacterium]|nr:hypothetical protein [Desulfobacterales bacterium]